MISLCGAAHDAARRLLHRVRQDLLPTSVILVHTHLRSCVALNREVWLEDQVRVASGHGRKLLSLSAPALLHQDDAGTENTSDNEHDEQETDKDVGCAPCTSQRLVARIQSSQKRSLQRSGRRCNVAGNL